MMRRLEQDPAHDSTACVLHQTSRAKAEVRALRAKKGVKAAIKRARKLAGKWGRVARREDEEIAAVLIVRAER